MILSVSLFGSLVSAETFGYGRTESVPINYSLIPTVNSSDYWDGLATPADIVHSLLDGLAWSVAGHTIDENIDMNGYTFTELENVIINDGSYLGSWGTNLLIANPLVPVGALDLGTSDYPWDNLELSGNVYGRGTGSWFNQTLLISGDHPVSTNSDATLVIQSEVNYISCVNLTEGGDLGFQICYDGTGGGEFVIRNMRDETEYMTIDRDDGGMVFHNETTFVNVTTTNITTTTITTSGIAGRTAGLLDTRGDPWILTGADFEFASSVDIDENLNVDGNATIDGLINGINISNLSNEYVPYTGANANVDLGVFNLTTTGNVTATYFIGNGSQLTELAGDYWTRTGTTLSPKTAGDDITTTGEVGGSLLRTTHALITDRTASELKFRDDTDSVYQSIRVNGISGSVFQSTVSGMVYRSLEHPSGRFSFEVSPTGSGFFEIANFDGNDGVPVVQFFAPVELGDNIFAKFGATNTDLQISSDGTYGNITALSGININSPFVNIDGDLNVTGYVDGKNYVTQYHRNATINTASADTWVNVTWDLTIDEETTSGYSLTDSNVSITIEHTGIYRVQGCLHPKNNGVGNQEASLYSRILINGVEAKCLQFANSKEFKTTGIDTMPFTGTLYAEAGQKVQLQYYVTSINIDFEGDAVFDDGVAGSINFEKLSK